MKKHSIYTKLFTYENTSQSIEFQLYLFKIKRKFDGYTYASIFELRISFLKGYEYLTIVICHFINLSIDFHRPI